MPDLLDDFLKKDFDRRHKQSRPARIIVYSICIAFLMWGVIRAIKFFYPHQQ
jgi:hypothetical protein